MQESKNFFANYLIKFFIVYGGICYAVYIVNLMNLAFICT